MENVSVDMRMEPPNSKGCSVRGLKYMVKFEKTYPDRRLVQTVFARIPWSHNVTI